MFSAEELIEVRDDLCERLCAIEQTLSTTALDQLLGRIHSLKGVARACGLHMVADLAHALESDLANEGKAALVTSYLDRMQDAIACGNSDPAVLDCLLATVRSRMVA